MIVCMPSISDLSIHSYFQVCLEIYKSKYIIFVAVIAPQKLKKLAILTTAVVVPDMLTIVPMHKERINWAKKTILLTIAISVPSPRTLDPNLDEPFPSSSNYKILK